MLAHNFVTLNLPWTVFTSTAIIFSCFPLISGKRNRGLILPKIDNGRNHHLVATSSSYRRSHSSGALSRSAAGGANFDPRSGPLTLELHHGASRQSVQLPTETLDRNKKYYVTFTINQNLLKNGEGSGGARGISSAPSGGGLKELEDLRPSHKLMARSMEVLDGENEEEDEDES